MEVKYISHMGDDLMVVNAARVSFGKQSILGIAPRHWAGYEVPEEVTKDRKLIAYLAIEM